MRRWGTALVAVLLMGGSRLACGSGPALKSSGATVLLIATVNERLSLVSARPAGLEPQRLLRRDEPLLITTSWNLNPARNGVVVRAYLSGDADDRNGRGAPALRGISGAGGLLWLEGGGVEVFRQPLTRGVNDLDSRTDAFEVQRILRDRMRAAAGDGDGVLTLVAEAY